MLRYNDYFEHILVITMPLFGKKSKGESKNMTAGSSGMSGDYPKELQPQGSYPTQLQPQGYPTQPAIHQHQTGMPPQQYTQPGMAYGAPPPYSAQPSAYQYGAPPPQAYYPQAATPSTVVVQGGFEAGARFGTGAQPNIPPPPPGVAPNAAQYAVMHGQNVVVSQQQGSYFSGTGDGGYCIW